MSGQVQPEIFIKILAEMLSVERERKKAQLRLQHKSLANGFMKAFRADFDGSARPSESTPRSKQTPREAVSADNGPTLSAS